MYAKYRPAFLKRIIIILSHFPEKKTYEKNPKKYCYLFLAILIIKSQKIRAHRCSYEPFLERSCGLMSLRFQLVEVNQRLLYIFLELVFNYILNNRPLLYFTNG